MDIEWEKARIRSQIREYRKLLTKEELLQYDKDLLEEFKAAVKADKELKKAFDSSRVVAVYKAVGGELPCDALAAYMRKAGKKTAYPLVKGEDMVFIGVKDPASELIPGSYGIPEPSCKKGIIDSESIDIMILPGIAFDPEGNRLGQGGGYYDRWLSSVPVDKRPLLIGVCMENQMMGLLPVSSSDIPVDMVLCI